MDERARGGVAVDLTGVVADVAQRVVIMYGGKVMEMGSVDDIFYNPQHPYTWGLLRSVPRLDSRERGELASIPGTPPDLLNPPVGCPFAARCEYAMKVCVEQFPDETVVTPGHKVSCWLQHPSAPKVERPVETGGRA